MPRMIECPYCKGNGHDDGRNANWDCILLRCLGCDNSGTIEDRRRQTANDRAVERLTEIANRPMFGIREGVALGGDIAWRHVLEVIREEQEADDAV
jgi:hypothetical protein